MLDFYVKTRTRFSLRDKRLFEISEVEITRVDCIYFGAGNVHCGRMVLAVNILYLGGGWSRPVIEKSVLLGAVIPIWFFCLRRVSFCEVKPDDGITPSS